MVVVLLLLLLLLVGWWGDADSAFWEMGRRSSRSLWFWEVIWVVHCVKKAVSGEGRMRREKEKGRPYDCN